VMDVSIPGERWVKIIGAVIGAALIGWLCWRLLIYPFFVQPQELAKEKGGRVVAEEQVKAGENIAAGTIEKIRERDVYREHTREIVERRTKEVDNAWKGETVGNEVDAAGAAALCELHVDLCRSDQHPEEVQ
jgi:hypothetical protein